MSEVRQAIKDHVFETSKKYGLRASSWPESFSHYCRINIRRNLNLLGSIILSNDKAVFHVYGPIGRFIKSISYANPESDLVIKSISYANPESDLELEIDQFIKKLSIEII